MNLSVIATEMLKFVTSVVLSLHVMNSRMSGWSTRRMPMFAPRRLLCTRIPFATKLEGGSLCLSRTDRRDARVHPRRIRHRAEMLVRSNLGKLSDQLLKALAWKLTRMLGADVVHQRAV